MDRANRQATAELKKQESEATEREVLYQTILDAIPDMVLVKRQHSKIFWANKVFREYYGMTNQQLRDIIDAPFNKPDYTQQYIKDDLYVMQSARILDIPCEPVKRHDGIERMFHTVKSPIFDGDGHVCMTIGVSRDITEKLESERILAEQQAKMGASSRLASLGEMAANIAHEINNPLAIISGRVSNIQKVLAAVPIDLQKVGDFLKIIGDTTARIAKIIRALRTLSRDGSRDVSVSISITELLDDVLTLCAEKFKSYEVVLVTEPFPKELRLHCRPVEICQVLMNLLANALDAVLLVEPRWVKIGVKKQDKMVSLEITDSGSGISEVVAKNMFNPFYTTKSVGSGTGLGLSISRGIACAHGGSLELKVGTTNTTFELCLPLLPQVP